MSWKNISSENFIGFYQILRNAKRTNKSLFQRRENLGGPCLQPFPFGISTFSLRFYNLLPTSAKWLDLFNLRGGG